MKSRAIPWSAFTSPVRRATHSSVRVLVEPDSDHAMTIPFCPIDPRRRLKRQGVTLPFHPVVFDKLFPYRLKGTWPYMKRQ